MKCPQIGNKKDISISKLDWELRGYELYQSSTVLHCVSTGNIADTSHLTSARLQINSNFIFPGNNQAGLLKFN